MIVQEITEMMELANKGIKMADINILHSSEM